MIAVSAIQKDIDRRNRAQEKIDGSVPTLSQTRPPAGKPELALIQASDVAPTAITWVWKGWLAAGKVHILAGAPGSGKTTITIAFAATVSMGGHWPDGSRAKPGSVVIWSGEDSAQDTLVPRLIAAGADLSRVQFVHEITEGTTRRPFDPATDVAALQSAIAVIGDVALLIVDPIVSAITGDSHKNAEVRRGLQPLADLTASTGCALIGITHLTKGTVGRDPVERVTGSLAFGAVARIVMVAARQQEQGDGPERLLVRAKSNIGPDDGGFGYDLRQMTVPGHNNLEASAVLWGQPVEGAARELLAAADAYQDESRGGLMNEAQVFLAGVLANGPVPVKAIQKEAKDADHSWATVRRAKKTLSVKARKSGMQGGWVWELPQRRCEDAYTENVSTFGDAEHLRDGDDELEVEI